jgi:hypothetical protein
MPTPKKTNRRRTKQRRQFQLASCVPSVECLRLLEREERARLLLLIARAIAQGYKPIGHRSTGKGVLERWLAEERGRPHRAIKGSFK